MNFPESQQILEKINSSQNILLNLHHNPDADSVGSATAFGHFLNSINKSFKIITSSKPSKNLEFLFDEFGYEVVDFKNFSFSEYDLFITNDSSSWDRVSGTHEAEKPNIFFINIDHHKTNQKFGSINLIRPDFAANCELLYYLFQDWGVIAERDFDYPDIHTPLLAGILGDTGGLRFPEAERSTYQVALDLMRFADKNKIIFKLYQSYDKSHVLVWKEIMQNLKIDEESKFVYSFVTKETMQKYGFPENAKAEIADMIFQNINNTDFGFVGAEDEGYISVSFRARQDVDVSVLASRLGGGGHKWASAARVWEGSYEKSVQKILEECIKFAKENA